MEERVSPSPVHNITRKLKAASFDRMAKIIKIKNTSEIFFFMTFQSGLCRLFHLSKYIFFLSLVPILVVHSYFPILVSVLHFSSEKAECWAVFHH